MKGRRLAHRLREAGLSKLLLIGFLVVAGLAFFLQLRDGSAPSQPLAFSHRAHAEKQIPCAFCHPLAQTQDVAGLPSTRLCANCHSVLPKSEETQKIFSYLERKQEIPWARVYQFPPHAMVIFTHARHVAAGISCEVCHGNVAQMTVAQRAVEHTMGWCMECHQKTRDRFSIPQLATDCLTCHK